MVLHQCIGSLDGRVIDALNEPVRSAGFQRCLLHDGGGLARADFGARVRADDDRVAGLQ